MKSSLLLAVCLVTLSLGRGQDACVDHYAIAPGMVDPAGELQDGVTTQDACQTTCDDNVACAGFDFKTDSSCSLTLNAVTAVVEANVDSNHYYRQKACEYSGTIQRCFFDYRGEYTADPRYGPLRLSGDVTGCLQLCLKFDLCGAVTYNNSTGECFVTLVTVTDLNDLNPEVGVMLYQFSGCDDVPFDSNCSPPTFLRTDNMAFSDGVYSPENNTQAACQANCVNVPECIGYDYNRVQDACFIHTDPTTTGMSNSNVDHYSAARECQSVDTCTYISQGAYMPAADTSSFPEPGVISLSECLAACNDNVTCNGISFNEMSNYDCRLYFSEDDVSGSTLEASTDGTHTYAQTTCVSSTTTMSTPTVAPGTCAVMYTEQPNRKSSGGVRQSAGESITTCQSLCSVDSSCTGLDYNTADLSCWHHYDPYPETVNSQIETETHYDKYFVCDICEFEYYPGTGVVSVVSINQLPGSLSESECLSACTQSSGCRAALYQNSNIQACSLVTGDPSSTTTDSTRNLYIRVRCEDELQGCEDGYQLYGNQKIVYGSQVDYDTIPECQLACDLDDQCIAFDFNSRNECYLITEYLELIAENGVQHYHSMPTCNGTDRQDCSFFATKPRVPTDDGYSEQAVSESDCFLACVDDIECSGLTYDSNICRTYPASTSWEFSDMEDSTSDSLVAYQLIGCDETQVTSASTITTTMSSVTTPTGCVNKWTPQDNSHVSHGLEQPGTGTLEECQTICVETVDCTAVDYKASTEKCWVHTAPDVLDNVVGETGVTFYYLERCVTPSTTDVTTPTGTETPTQSTSPQATCVTEYEEFTNMKKIGATDSVSKSVEECLVDCEVAPVCVGFDYTGEGRCWFHEDPETDLVEPNPNDGVISHFVRRWQCGGCYYTPYPNRAVSDPGTILGDEVTAVDCLNQCTEIPACSGADFTVAQDTDLGQCELYLEDIDDEIPQTAMGTDHWRLSNCLRATTPTAATSSTTSTMSTITTSIPLTTRTPPVQCQRAYRKYTDAKRFSGQSVPGAETVQDCMMACDDEPTCIGFDFVRQGSCWIHTDIEQTIETEENEGVDHYTIVQICGACSYEEYPGLKAPSGVEKSSLTTREHCFSGCNQDVTCFAIDYNPTQQKCYFFDSPQLGNLVPEMGVEHYEQYECVERCDAVYEEYEGMKVSGGDRDGDVTTVEDCERVCNDTRHICSGFDFTGDDTCWLINRRPHPGRQDAPSTEAVTHYQRSGYDCGACQYSYEAGREVSGISGTIAAGSESITSCLNACSRMATCQSASFNLDSSRCVLYDVKYSDSLQDSSTNEYFEKDDCPGIATTRSTATPTTVTMTESTSSTAATTPPEVTCDEDYDEFPGQKVHGGSRANAVNTVADCMDACDGDDMCIGFDYNDQDDSCWMTTNPDGPLVDQNPNEDVTHYRLYRACGGCKYYPKPNKNAPNGVLLTATLTEDQCLEFCAEDARCAAVDYKASEQACYWYDVIPSVNDNSDGVRHWVKDDACTMTEAPTTPTPGPTPAPNCDTFYTPAVGKKTFGGIFRQDSRDVSSCQAQCDNNALCVGFDFNVYNFNNDCYIQNDITQNVVDHNPDVEQVSHYTQQWLCNQNCFFQPYTQRRRAATGTLQSGVTSINSCLQRCSVTASCFEVDFRHSTAECYFFQNSAFINDLQTNTDYNHYKKGNCASQGTTLTPAPGTTIGRTAGPTPPPASSCEVGYILNEDSHRFGGDAVSTVDSVAACRTECEERLADPLLGCSGFDYDNIGIDKCWILPNQPGIFEGLDDTDHYELVFTCSGCRYKPLFDKISSQGTLQAAYNGRNQCLHACNLPAQGGGNAGCVAAEVRDNGDCYHLTSVPDPVAISQIGAVYYQRNDCGEINNTP